MNASELTQRRRLCSLARAQQCVPSTARIPLSYEYRTELLATEYPCLPAEISAPLIDFDSLSVSYTLSDQGILDLSYSFSWGCVPGATHYKVFIRGPGLLSGYINVGVPPTYTNFRTSSVIPSLMFNDTSPLLTIPSFSSSIIIDTNSNDVTNLNFFVFAYRNGKRSNIPCTQLGMRLLGPNVETFLWPVITQEFTGGAGFAPANTFEFDTVTVTNRVTHHSRILTPEEVLLIESLVGYPEGAVGATAIANATF